MVITLVAMVALLSCFVLGTSIMTQSADDNGTLFTAEQSDTVDTEEVDEQQVSTLMTLFGALDSIQKD